MSEGNRRDNFQEDPTLLLVSGSKGDKASDKEYVKKLANAILEVYYKHSFVAKLRCVGAAAVNNAIKASIIAKGEALKRGNHIFVDPSFTTVTFHGEEKTGIVLRVCEGKRD